jgi:hypothetical protein
VARKSRQVESRMISEYLKLNYPKFTYIMEQPLGKVDEGLMKTLGYRQALGISRPFRPLVDAVVILPRHLLLVEAKVWNVINGLAKLPLYKSLVQYTPELQEYLPREVIMQLVVGWTNDNLQIMASSLDVSVKVYAPAWLEEVVQSMHKYWTKEYRENREAKLRLRQALNIE